MGVGFVGGTKQRAAGRSCGVHETLIFERGDNVGTLGICKFVVFVDLNGIKAGGGDDCAVFFLDKFVLLGIVDSLGLADGGAQSAFAVFKLEAVVGVDSRNLRNGLGKGNVNSGTVVESEIELVGHLLHGTFFGAGSAAGADVLVYIAGLSADLDREVAHKSLDLFNLAEGVYFDFLVLGGFNHFWGQNTSCTVEGGEGFVYLSHLSADCGGFFDNVDLISCVGNVKSGLDTGDTSADYKSALGNRAFAGGQGSVEMHLRDGGAAENDRLFGGGGHILMYPGALLTDVGYFHHIGVYSGRCGGLPEGGLVHTGGAGADYDARKTVFLNGILNKVLTCLRAHILVVGGKNNAGLFAESFGNLFYIDRGGDVTAAPTDEYAYSLHCAFPPYLLYFLMALTMAC